MNKPRNSLVLRIYLRSVHCLISSVGAFFVLFCLADVLNYRVFGAHFHWEGSRALARQVRRKVEFAGKLLRIRRSGKQRDSNESWNWLLNCGIPGALLLVLKLKYYRSHFSWPNWPPMCFRGCSHTPNDGNSSPRLLVEIVHFRLTLGVQEGNLKLISFPIKASFRVVPKEIYIKNEKTIKYCHTMLEYALLIGLNKAWSTPRLVSCRGLTLLFRRAYPYLSGLHTHVRCIVYTILWLWLVLTQILKDSFERKRSNLNFQGTKTWAL